MVTKDKIITGIDTFVNEYLDNMSANNPAVCFMKPLATRAISKKVNELSSYLDLIAEPNGNIDVAGILSEMTESLIKVNPFIVNIPALGDVLIGGGRIEVGIPFLNKKVIFKDSDVNYLKELLISESYGRNIVKGIHE